MESPLTPSRLQPRNINQALGWLLAAVIVPLLVGVAILLAVQWRHERALSRDQLSALAQTLVQAVDRELGSGLSQLEVLAWSPTIDEREWERLQAYADNIAASRPGSVIALMGPDGQELMKTAVPWGQPLPNIWKLADQHRTAQWQGRALPLSSQSLTRQVFATGKPGFSDLYYGVNIQRPTLALSLPVVRDDQVRYALTMSFPPALLEQLIRSAVTVPGVRATVIDRNGLVVASNAAAASRLVDRIPPIERAPDATSGHYQTVSRDGIEREGAYATSGLNGYVVRVSLPVDLAFSPARATTAGLLSLMLVALLVSVVLGGMLRRRLAAPLRELGQQAERGELPPEGAASGIAEIDALAQALRAGSQAEQARRSEHVMRVMAQQQEALVKHSEARLKRLIDQLFVFVAVLDLDGRLLECNAAPLQRAGISGADVLGRPFADCPWWAWDPAVAEVVRQAVQRAAGGETVRCDVHSRFSNGDTATVDFQLAPLRDEHGQIVNLVASSVDVESRVAALHEVERSKALTVDAAVRFDAEHRLLEATLDAAPVGITVSDPHGDVLRLNRVGAQLLGVSAGDDKVEAARAVLGWAHSDQPETAQPLQPDDWPLQQALAQRRAVTRVVDLAPADATVRRRTVLMSAAPVLDAHGTPIAGVLVQVDITSRVQAEAALRRADRQKDEFLATLAHELRNPLAPIRTAAELIRLRNPSDAGVQRAREIIARQVVHLSRLVDDLLDVSRITSGTITLRPEALDLGVVAAGAVESMDLALAGAALVLEQQIAPLVLVRGDPTRLGQCVVNLLHNAVKFTSKGGHIVLRVAQEGPMAVVEIADSGIGISPASVERIFELFAQEHPSGWQGNSGLGIGLALTRKLVTLHGGTVRATSPGRGQGSTFRIELPAIAGSADSADSAGPQAAGEPAAAGPRPRVLVVDDNLDAADLLGEILALSEFDIQVVYNGEDALRVVHQQAPDAVLLDIGLPDLDGYEVCRRIRAAELVRQPVVVALTGWGQDRDRDSATQAGFNAHLTKPAEPDRMVALLRELIAKRGV